MWISKMMKNDTVEEKAESGNVTISGKDVEIDSSVATRKVKIYAPYGYSAVPPVDNEVMLIPSADGQSIIGSKVDATNLESGEIEISSKGGAKIILRNDGSVVINSLVISREGVIEQ